MLNLDARDPQRHHHTNSSAAPGYLTCLVAILDKRVYKGGDDV